MSTLTTNINIGFNHFFPKSYGISRESKNSVSQNETSITFGWKNDISSDLIEIFKDCSRPDWDGYGAMAVSYNEIDTARKFLWMLPESITTPEVSPDPDGAISFNWGNGYDQMFSISAEKNILIYAGLFNDGVKKHGQLPFYNEIPIEITDILSRYFRQI